MLPTAGKRLPERARRVLSTPLARVLVLGAILVLMMTLNTDVLGSYSTEPVKAVAHIIALVIAGLAVYVGYAQFVESRAIAELSLRGMGRQLGAGLLLGAGLFTACILILMGFGIYQVIGLNPLSYLLPALASALGSSFYEELLFRGTLYGSVEQWLGSWAVGQRLGCRRWCSA